MGILPANCHTKIPKIRQLQIIMLLYPVSHAQLATLSPALIPPTLITPIPPLYQPILWPLRPPRHPLHRAPRFHSDLNHTDFKNPVAKPTYSLFPATSNFIPVTSDSNPKTHGTWSSLDLVYTYLAVPALSSPAHVPPLLVIQNFNPAVPT